MKKIALPHVLHCLYFSVLLTVSMVTVLSVLSAVFLCSNSKVKRFPALNKFRREQNSKHSEQRNALTELHLKQLEIRETLF